MTSLISKLSVATMNCNPGAAKAENKLVKLATIIGFASGIKMTVGKDGDPTMGLTGQFEGTNLKTGEVFNSGVCYLPSGILELVAAPIVEDQSKEKDKRTNPTIRFAFLISAVPAKNPIGYSYSVEPLVEPEHDDPLADMRKALTGHSSIPQLPAPAAEAATEAAAPAPAPAAKGKGK